MTGLGVDLAAPRVRWAALAVVFLILCGTRAPLAPKYLFYFDSINFALALDRFDPASHQPQPPGYPLFVAFTRFLHWFIAGPETVFLLAGLLAGACLVVFLWRLTDEMMGRGAGVFAAVLMIFNPVFWFGGLTNQVRIFSGLASCAIAFLAWRAWNRPAPAYWFYLTACAAGMAGGFRPPTLLYSFPLLVAIAIRRRSLRQGVLSTGLLTVTVGAWLSVLLWHAGGISAYLTILREYSAAQFSGTSSLFGAAPKQATQMAMSAVIWSFLGVLSWIWATPLVRLSEWSPAVCEKGWFLTLWASPALLFLALVHVGDPDQTLFVVPAGCAAGAWVLWRAAERFGSHRVLAAWLLAVTAIGVNCYWFFSKGRGLTRPTSYQVVAKTDRAARQTFEAIERLAGSGKDLRIVAVDSLITWRQLSYYFPQVPVIALSASSPERFFKIVGNKGTPEKWHDGHIAFDCGTRLVFILPEGGAVREELGRQLKLKAEGPVWYNDPDPAHPERFADLTFGRPAPPDKAAQVRDAPAAFGIETSASQP